MTDFMQLSARPRTVVGKNVSRLRRDGWIPAVVYGHRSAPVNVMVAAKEMERLIGTAGTSNLVQIRVDGEREPRVALVRDVQRHVTRRTIAHVDFMQVRMDETVRSEVPVVLIGESAAVARQEGVIDHGLTSLLVEALPGDLPSEISVDVTVLEHVGDAIWAGDLDLGPGVVLLAGSEEAVARLGPISRVVTRSAEEEAELEGEAGAAGVGSESVADGGD
jgi:large subunit ribosomal protein L25